MLICVVLYRAEISITDDLIEKMNLIENLFEIANETLTFLENKVDGKQYIQIGILNY
ncbi:MAG TPA: hypothetical protein VFK40_09410 [Nitrososphaeraceae archaeon]|nr:hypothetical protein [Nitrososphaeraceae archaeon]